MSSNQIATIMQELQLVPSVNNRQVLIKWDLNIQYKKKSLKKKIKLVSSSTTRRPWLPHRVMQLYHINQNLETQCFRPNQCRSKHHQL